MSAWDSGVFESDTALDVVDVLVECEVPTAEAFDAISELAAEREGDEAEVAEVWIAAAAWCLEHDVRDPRVLRAGVGAIDSGAVVKMWGDSGPSAAQERKGVEEELRERLVAKLDYWGP